jgi:hypothetical protein
MSRNMNRHNATGPACGDMIALAEIEAAAT